MRAAATLALSLAAALSAAAPARAGAPAAASPLLVTLGLQSINATATSVRLLRLAPGAGVVGGGAPVAYTTPPAPCAGAYVPALGAFAAATAGDSLVLLSGADGSLLRTVPLQPPFLLPLLAHSPSDGLLYGVGTPAASPGPFLTLVSVNASSGAVTALGPLLSNNVLECAGGVSASGVLMFTYTGPLQLQVVGGACVAPAGGCSAADGFNVALGAGAGSVLALAPLPPPPGGGAASGVLLLAATDTAGSVGALASLDPATGVVTPVVPLPPTYVNPSQGALVVGARGGVAALAQHVAPDGNVTDVLLLFNVTAASYAATPLADAAAAPMGVWGLGWVAEGGL